MTLVCTTFRPHRSPIDHQCKSWEFGSYQWKHGKEINTSKIKPTAIQNMSSNLGFFILAICMKSKNVLIYSFQRLEKINWDTIGRKNFHAIITSGQNSSLQPDIISLKFQVQIELHFVTSLLRDGTKPPRKHRERFAYNPELGFNTTACTAERRPKASESPTVFPPWSQNEK